MSCLQPNLSGSTLTPCKGDGGWSHPTTFGPPVSSARTLRRPRPRPSLPLPTEAISTSDSVFSSRTPHPALHRPRGRPVTGPTPGRRPAPPGPPARPEPRPRLSLGPPARPAQNARGSPWPRRRGAARGRGRRAGGAARA